MSGAVRDREEKEQRGRAVAAAAWGKRGKSRVLEGGSRLGVAL